MCVRLFKKITDRIKKRFQELLFTKGFSFFERFGIHVLPVHYYTPIPDTRLLRKRANLWSKELPLHAIDLNIEGQKNLLKTVCTPFQSEYLSFSKEKTANPLEYYLNNGAFGFVSGQMHYCIVRYFKPRKIIEVGSGFSTLASMTALERNSVEGYPCELLVIDPYPPNFIENTVTGIRLIRRKIEDIDVSLFEDLFENDLLFIDSSHTVKIGGDVNFLILEILPMLKKGVTVHIHDIQFPYEYFKVYAMQNHFFWQEQYLVQAFLMYNKSFKILWCASYMHYKYPELLAEYFSPCPPTRVPTSLYIQKVL